ncbi:sulfur oxidation c-type cytochrome SoxA [Paralimibaculum aggregatum]|uniref:SoxAX cytochrome complex subunit A n=1 Tax=Paralimibaculum aggregatum TaxID=3036245 RepID=A0ABQ6LIE5_9RHOB|nr:sulfur oxidation c-type cytochrome SoxA [Limibaculum sp. NKW23]GMG81995.1 sulfur oxidation c-type cytochrome SoxA [Limibaculum sp. NKW23]
MTPIKTAIALFAGTGLVAGLAVAGPGPDEDQLVIEGETLITEVAAPEDHPLDTIYSGWRFRSDETQALEIDDFENPAMVAVEYGLDLWDTAAGSSEKSCADCHGDVDSLAGLRANMPKWNEAAGQPWSLEHWINWSITEHQGAEPWKWESEEMLAMTALIGLQSRGMPMTVETEGPMADWIARGKELYYTRVGQLDMACNQCHEDNWGQMIRADHLSQGMINGFPTYRFKWSGLGSLHRRFSGCMKNIRAKPYKRGSDEFVALEAYLAARGAGLSIETPAVRN